MDLRELAEDYFRGMRCRDIEQMVGKFAEHGGMILPDGRELTGHANLRDLYTGLFRANAPTPQPENFVVGVGQVAVEIVANLEDGTSRRTANFFQFGEEGKITRLSIYRRG